MLPETREPSWRIRDGAVFRELDGEAVILNLDTGIYFGLNAVGTAIWQLVEQLCQAGAVADALTHRYDVTRERAHDDIIALMTQLVAKGLAEPVDEGSRS